MPAQVSLQDLFHRVPTDSQVMSHVLHGHDPAKFDDEPLEPPRVAPIRICKGNFHLPNRSTDHANHSLNKKLDKGGTQTDRESHPRSTDRPFLLHVSTPAMGTLESSGVLLDFEFRTTLFESRMHMADSSS